MHIRRFIDQDTRETLVCSLVLSHMDYANGILPGVSNSVVSILQIVQNWAPKLVLKRKKYSSSTQALLDLHCLPIASRIKYKILMLVHKCLKGQAPS